MARNPRASLGASPVRAVLRPDGADAVEAEVLARRVAVARAEGYAEGRREAEEGAGELLRQAVERLDRARERAEAELPRELIELSVEIAALLLRVSIADGTYDLERIIRSALAGGGVDRGRCTVYVNADDLSRLSGVTFREETRVAAHPDLERGTVHVETPQGLLVRDLHEALEQVRESLLESLV